MVGVIAVCAVTSVAWSEPSLKVITAENGLGYCPASAAHLHVAERQASEDLLLLMFSLSLGRGGLG